MDRAAPYLVSKLCKFIQITYVYYKTEKSMFTGKDVDYKPKDYLLTDYEQSLATKGNLDFF